MTRTVIAWDLGATKCAAGIVEYNSITHALICKRHFSVKLTEATSLDDLINRLEEGLGVSMHKADAICIGAAGHYDGATLLLEGVYPYPMEFAKVAKRREWPNYTVIHDYAPIVCATFTSYMEEPDNIKRLNSCAMQQHGRRVALGIGTGLGLKDGVLLSNGDFWLGKNEIGHIGITAPPIADKYYLDRHHEITHYLQEKLHLQHGQPITFEKLLSGNGTVRLYQFFHPSQKNITPEEVGVKLQNGSEPELLAAFAWYIGLFLGAVQLTFMPEGGIWITGGVALKNLNVFDHPELMEGIYSSPAYRIQREEYPLGILCNHEHALVGSGYYAAKRLINRAG